jgi:hypothetical protein
MGTSEDGQSVKLNVHLHLVPRIIRAKFYLHSTIHLRDVVFN